jgi:serine/threonine protein kinase/tetratricopeptide (TPR) repeat protein
MSDGSPSLDHGQATLARGASIGRYVVLGLVGRGGMGEVYAAYDPELDRKVAVKLLRVKPGAGVSLTEGRQRTLREAQAIARLSHPNVVVVFDVGTFEEKVFIAMEFVEGHTAGFWAQSQNRTWQETLKVYLAAGHGLAAAHEKGLVHRDFKPDNVMVSRDGQVRVMDFGLARQAEKPVAVNGGAGGKMVAIAEGGVVTTQRLPVPLAEPGAPVAPLDGSTLVLTSVSGDHRPPEFEASTTAMFDQRLTRTGAMMGTPAYMAPEQFRGRATDARSDQFAFCVALYEALYGERPFGGNTLMALTTNVVNGRIRETPSNADVPLWIRKILLRGLRVNADERFPSMDELLEALGKNPAVARRRWFVATSAMLLAVGLGYGMRQGMADSKPACGGGPEKLEGIWELTAPGAGETPRQAQLHAAFLKTAKSYAKDVWATTSRALTNYTHAWTSMYKETCEAAVVNKVQSLDVMDLRMDCLNERLAGLRALTDVFSDASGEVVENAVSAANALASLDRCADVPVLRAVLKPPDDGGTKQKVDDLRKRLADLKARFDAGRWGDASKEGPRLVSEAHAIGYKPLIAEALAQEGTMLLRSNDLGAAEQALAEAFWAADASRHDELRAAIAADLVYVVGYLQRRFSEGQRWAKTADGVLERLGGHELLRAWLLNDVGNVLEAQGDKDAAVRAQQQGLELKQRALGSDHPDVGISEGNLAVALQGLGRHSEALTHVDRAISLLEAGLGSGHPALAIQLNNRGEILNLIGRPGEARQSFERARAIWERELGMESRYLAYGLTGIGVSYLAEGSAANALVPLERAFRIREAQETDEAKRAETSFALARALWASNRDRSRARALAERARHAFAQLPGNANAREVEVWLKSRS